MTLRAVKPPSREPGLPGAYQEALEGYLAEPDDEAALNRAYELGREALAEGYGIVDLITMHQTSLMNLLAGGRFRHRPLVPLAATICRFLLQAVSPFAALHLSGQESIAALRRLNSMLDGEAKRIAQSLHDEASQLLATAYLELAAIRHEIEEPLKNRIDRVTSHLDQAREQLRHLSHELRPPMLDPLGLRPALDYLLDGFRQRSGIEANLQIRGLDGRLPARIEQGLYRLIQEALTNVSRHAHTSEAEVELTVGDGVVSCVVRDRGAGFDPDTIDRTQGDSGLGIPGMRERVHALNGTLEFLSSPGTGTEVRISVPLAEKP